MGSASAPSSGYSFLVISGDSANLQLMTQVIARRGDLTLQTAPNGVEGMELAATTPNSKCWPNMAVKLPRARRGEGVVGLGETDIGYW
jgi:hypothetical protein